MNADRLSDSRNLTMKEKARLVQSPTALFKAVDQMHTRERRLLSNVQRVETKARLDRVWCQSARNFDPVSARNNDPGF